MKLGVLAILALIPAPALAGFECTTERQFGGGTCEAYACSPFQIEQAGEIREVKFADQIWQAFDVGLTDDAGELVLVMPPQTGKSGMISIFPDDKFLFTAHAAGPVAING